MDICISWNNSTAWNCLSESWDLAFRTFDMVSNISISDARWDKKAEEFAEPLKNHISWAIESFLVVLSCPNRTILAQPKRYVLKAAVGRGILPFFPRLCEKLPEQCPQTIEPGC